MPQLLPVSATTKGWVSGGGGGGGDGGGGGRCYFILHYMQSVSFAPDSNPTFPKPSKIRRLYATISLPWCFCILSGFWNGIQSGSSHCNQIVRQSLFQPDISHPALASIVVTGRGRKSVTVVWQWAMP